jgi:hypothetical protein
MNGTHGEMRTFTDQRETEACPRTCDQGKAILVNGCIIQAENIRFAEKANPVSGSLKVVYEQDLIKIKLTSEPWGIDGPWQVCQIRDLAMYRARYGKTCGCNTIISRVEP